MSDVIWIVERKGGGPWTSGWTTDKVYYFLFGAIKYMKEKEKVWGKERANESYRIRKFKEVKK